jgi:hypothetical protein
MAVVEANPNKPGTTSQQQKPGEVCWTIDVVQRAATCNAYAVSFLFNV